jgi:hypothetical protein
MALGTATQVDSEVNLKADRPWVCIVWDDPVNLMTYVTYVFMVLFGYSKEKATELMREEPKFQVVLARRWSEMCKGSMNMASGQRYNEIMSIN